MQRARPTRGETALAVRLDRAMTDAMVRTGAREDMLRFASAFAALKAGSATQGGVEVLVSMANMHSIYYATAGYPAITLPIGRNDKGEPLGVTLIGKKGQDAQLLSYAYAFEQVTRAHIEPDLP